MPDHDSGQVYAFFQEDPLLIEPHLLACVWVEMGVPVRRCAFAVARRIRSTSRVTPGLSVAHLSIPAFTPVLAIPSTMSCTNMSAINSGPPIAVPGPRKWK